MTDDKGSDGYPSSPEGEVPHPTPLAPTDLENDEIVPSPTDLENDKPVHIQAQDLNALFERVWHDSVPDQECDISPHPDIPAATSASRSARRPGQPGRPFYDFTSRMETPEPDWKSIDYWLNPLREYWEEHSTALGAPTRALKLFFVCTGIAGELFSFKAATQPSSGPSQGLEGLRSRIVWWGYRHVGGYTRCVLVDM